MKEKYIQDQYYIAVFDSRNHAMQLYQHLKRNNFSQFQLIATPCKIKAGCSYSIKFNKLEDYDLLLAHATKIKKKISAVYIAEKVNRNRVLKKLNIT